MRAAVVARPCAAHLHLCIDCAPRAVLLQAQDERAVFAWIYKIDSLYYGFLESKRGIAAHQSMMTTAGSAAGGRARSSTMR